MKIEIADLGDFITTQELSFVLKFGYAKTLKFIKYSGVKYSMIGNSYRVYKKDLLDFLANSPEFIDLGEE